MAFSLKEARWLRSKAELKCSNCRILIAEDSTILWVSTFWKIKNPASVNNAGKVIIASNNLAEIESLKTICFIGVSRRQPGSEPHHSACASTAIES
jgi:hypothetical protein